MTQLDFADEPAGDALTAECGIDSEVQDLAFSFRDAAGNGETCHLIITKSDREIMRKVVGRRPLRGFGRRLLDAGHRIEVSRAGMADRYSGHATCSGTLSAGSRMAQYSVRTVDFAGTQR